MAPRYPHGALVSMSMPPDSSGIEDLRDVFAAFEREVTTYEPLFDPPLRKHLTARVLAAIDEGMPSLELVWSRGGMRGMDAESWSSDGVLIGALERSLNHEDNPSLRWLAVAYWVVLCDFERIAANLEPLAVMNLNESTWLVAGALWVQWGSSQPTTLRLREVLGRLRTLDTSFDAHIASTLAGERGAAHEAATIIDALLTDPLAELPRRRP